MPRSHRVHVRARVRVDGTCALRDRARRYEDAITGETRDLCASTPREALCANALSADNATAFPSCACDGNTLPNPSVLTLGSGLDAAPYDSAHGCVKPLDWESALYTDP